MIENLYEALEIQPSARPEIIKASYRILTQKYHPDKNPGDKLAEEKFKFIQIAYEILSDAEKRNAYDVSLLRKVDNSGESTVLEKKSRALRQNPPEPVANRASRDILHIVLSGRMLTALLMGFSSGLPLLLATGSVLQAWLKEAGVDLGTIGLFALVGLPYTLKFLWAPLLDRFAPIAGMGRRRGWLLLIQLTLIAAIAGLGLTDPKQSLPLVTLAAVLAAFFSASQDIVIDAYRRESLADNEQGLGASFYVNGYRVGLLLASGGGLILADFIPFQAVYWIMAAAMLPGLITTLLCSEPLVVAGAPRTLREAVVQPFVEYFSRQDALLILLFVLLYKVGEMMASQMTTPFYLDLGFTKTEIGAVVKLFGFWATVIGGLLGGLLMLRLGVYRALWLFGALQAVGLSGFVILARLGHSLPGLALAITSENLFSGMATTAYVAFMATLTHRKFTATQYALLSSLMGIPRVVLNAPTGYLATWLGWEGFFLFCMAATLPGLWLLTQFRAWMEPERKADAAPAPLTAANRLADD